MVIAFVVAGDEVPRSFVRAAARHLAARPGVEVEVLTGEQATSAGRHYDVVLASGPCISAALALRARRWVLLAVAPGLGGRPATRSERVAQADAEELPIAVVTDSARAAEILLRSTPARPCAVVRPGLEATRARAEPAARAASREPLRVLTDGPEALAAVTAMRQPHRLLGTLGQRSRFADPHAGVDVLVAMAPGCAVPLEALARGTACVVTTDGRESGVLVHRQNALLVDPEDAQGAARLLDALAVDRSLLSRLQGEALVTVGDWPSWERQAAALEDVLRGVLASPAHAEQSAIVRAHDVLRRRRAERTAPVVAPGRGDGVGHRMRRRLSARLRGRGLLGRARAAMLGT